MFLLSAREPPIAPADCNAVESLQGTSTGATPGKPRELRRPADGTMVALAAMTGGITHDFRNILALIEAGVSVAERHADEPELVRLCLAGLHEGVQRGIKLTTRLLEVSRDQDRGAQPRDLNELLERLQVFLKYGAGPDVRVVFELAPSLPPCIVEGGEFDAAILNLVVNARDAMPGGGEIRISTSVVAGSPTFVHLRVQDTGQGMSRAVLRRVFDRHFTTKGDVGTGLGIPQVSAFMNRVGGHINIESAIGTGTTFELVFPAIERDASGASEQGTPAGPPASNGCSDRGPGQAGAGLPPVPPGESR